MELQGDRILTKVWNAFTEGNIQPILSPFNVCLKEEHFHRIWHVNRLIILPKPGKPLDSPSSYRPLYLLDNVSKLLERMLLEWMDEALQSVDGGFHSQQYGFWKERSTNDAIQAMVMELRQGLSTPGMYLVVR